MRPTFLDSRTSIQLTGKAIPGAEDRQRQIAGFDQAIYSRSRVLCIGAGGLIANIVPTLVRKAIGGVAIYDHDAVETSNLNRQRFYAKDIGKNKAISLVENLEPECIAATDLRGYALRFEEAIASGLDLSCDVAVCGVDNDLARVAASRYFRLQRVPVIITAVSSDGDHGYVFVQEREGSCIGCLFPDIADNDRHPCPGTPAIADILQAVGSLAVYAVDTLLMNRDRRWNYRRISLSDGTLDGGSLVPTRPDCSVCGPAVSEFLLELGSGSKNLGQASDNCRQ
jgi:molybdopterin/thiamine biosynthesis adenylyltransferase